MGNIVLLGIGIYMVAMIGIGLKRGFVKMAFSLVSVFAIVVLVNLLTPSTKELIKSTPVYETIKKQVQVYVEDNISEATKGITQSGVNAQEQIINRLPLPWAIRTSLSENNTKEKYAEMKVESFSEYIAEAITDIINSTLAFVILYIVLTILLKIIVAILDIITILPVINQFNTLGGAVLGLAESIVLLWIACIIITIFSATEWGRQINTIITQNSFLSLIYDNNPIQHMIDGIIKF